MIVAVLFFYESRTSEFKSSDIQVKKSKNQKNRRKIKKYFQVRVSLESGKYQLQRYADQIPDIF